MTALVHSFAPGPADGPPAAPVRSERIAEVLGWAALAGLVLVAGPLFVRMPLWPDVAWYDTCARHVLRGGALERDFLFLTPPAMVWALALVRSLFGWSSEAVRLADLAVVAAVVGLLVAWLRRLGLSRAVRVWTAVLLLAAYLTAGESAHCQPDTWMLLPALVALHLRRRQLGRLEGAAAPGRVMAWGTVEGLCWGLACLVKPYVALPGLLVWLASAAMLCRGPRPWSRLAGDAAGLLAGGLLMAAVWQGWLISSGSWQVWWHDNAACRGEFYSTTAPLRARPLLVLFQLWPWGLLHLLALPVAVGALARSASRYSVPAGRSGGEGLTEQTLTALLGALYLGWLVQSAGFQSAFDYHLAPTLLLALTLGAGWLAAQSRPRWGWAWGVVGLLAIVGRPALAPSRLALWERCWADGGSPEVRDQLALAPNSLVATNWRDLREVESFLRDRQVGDGELLCFDATAVPLYLRLGVTPAVRYLYPSTQIYFLVGQREAIRADLVASRPRYVVTDVKMSRYYEAMMLGLAPDLEAADPKTLAPQLAERFPYSEPVVFRAGRYLVHEVRQVDRGRP